MLLVRYFIVYKTSVVITLQPNAVIKQHEIYLKKQQVPEVKFLILNYAHCPALFYNVS